MHFAVMKPPAWTASTCGSFSCDVLGSASCPSVERAQELRASGLKVQPISCVLTTRLSSMYAPIIPLALVFVAFGCKEPDDEF